MTTGQSPRGAGSFQRSAQCLDNNPSPRLHPPSGDLSERPQSREGPVEVAPGRALFPRSGERLKSAPPGLDHLGAWMLFRLCRAEALRKCLLLAHVRAMFGVAVIFVSGEVVDHRLEVCPNDRIGQAR
jgi:hypothetical protein